MNDVLAGGDAAADPDDVADLDTASTIAELAQVRHHQRWWQAREVALLAHYADVTAHVETGPEVPRTQLLQGDRMVSGGGEGAPRVSEFAALEIAALWNEGVEGVDGRFHQALDLRHRFPQLWRHVMTADLPTWVAAKITTKASKLGGDAARQLDAELAEVIGNLPTPRLLRLADGLVLKLSPPDDAQASRSGDQTRRGVWVRQRPDARATTIAGICAVLDAGDADALEQQVRRLAQLLAQGGDQRGLDDRRAAALAVMAYPARALQLLQASVLDELPADVDDDWGPCPAAGQAGHLCGQVIVDPERLLPAADLVIHLTDAAVAGGADRSPGLGAPAAAARVDDASGSDQQIARVERIGPMLADWLGDLLAHHRVTVRPVLNLDRLAPVDSYEIPRSMRQAIHYREPYDTFPGSTRHTWRGCDLDHTEPYQVGGPPGQTSLENLAPLSRRAHRAKTFGGWQLHQVVPGVLVWRSPGGYVYLVTAGQSILIDTPAQHARHAA